MTNLFRWDIARMDVDRILVSDWAFQNAQNDPQIWLPLYAARQHGLAQVLVDRCIGNPDSEQSLLEG